MDVILYTDGSARGNPNGPGGYGAVLQFIDAKGQLHEREYSQGYIKTTNNRMELMAAIVGLEALIKPCNVKLYSDSQYLCNAFNQHWIEGWIKKGWKRGKNEPVKNRDLWERLLAAKAPHNVEFLWVKGHAGNAGNEKVDELARTYAGDCRSKIREGYLPLEGWQSLLASEYSQGTDVPDDAQMLLDGKITTDEYHMGRGQGKSAQGSLADD